jgi:CDAN1-interacting nuclease 1
MKVCVSILLSSFKFSPSLLLLTVIALLVRKLNDRYIAFETEADLRRKGKAKTPDVLLLIPMIIKFDLRSSNGLIRQVTAAAINWIDSKALFADHDTYEEHMEQFHSYISRYGRGLVIYWHGFTESLLGIIDHETLVISDHFPSYWRYPTGELADGTMPKFMASTIDTKEPQFVLNRVLFDDDES